MEVKIARNCGFCKGVQSAVQTALSVAGDNVFILGELVHNPQVVKYIEDKGIRTVDTLEEVPDGATVIFRSHGVPKSYYETCAERGIRYIDCTCGFVKKIQEIVEQESGKGRHVCIVGKKDHPEVIGLLGWCATSATVVRSVEELDEGALESLRKNDVSIVSQTTFPEAEFEKIVKFIRKLCEKTVAVFKTICYTTLVRQKEVEAIAKSCDCVIVVGGKNSNNTGKLYDIARLYCEDVRWVQDPGELVYKAFNNIKCVGIVSGASTPKEQAQEVLFNMAEETEVTTAAEETADEVVVNPVAEEEVAAPAEAAAPAEEAPVVEEAPVNPMDAVVNEIDRKSKFKKGQIIHAAISQADEEGLKVLHPYSKMEVLLPKEEIDCEVYNPADYADKIGDMIDVMVIGFDPLKLSQKRIRIQQEEESIIADIKEGKEFSAEITGTNKGGLTGEIGSYQLFVPAREIRMGYVKDLEKYVGKKLRLRLIEIKRYPRREIIASQRVILQEEADAKEAAKLAREEEFFNDIEVDEIVEGKVERTTNFGAFVSVRGFDCLAHISDLSWSPVDKVTDVLEIGKTYKFVVLKVDKDKKKVSLGYKQLQPKPWELVPEKYAVGDVVTGKVLRIVDFGAFVQIEKGVDALLHISQISNERIGDAADVLSVGQEVEVKIMAIDAAAQKMNVSMKALLPASDSAAPAASSNDRRKRFRENREDDDTSKSRKPRAPRHDTDELSAWSEGSVSGASIGDLLSSAQEQKNNK
ncbi:MAG: 4-hydroxy-3-methylbut-2-enyl diphosphate reductase, partial [Clostridia bacterium]|nr:4-hydroxy-3-methylbut-2-enyl diphosphate reductase [Clostridia bacterium]